GEGQIGVERPDGLAHRRHQGHGRTSPANHQKHAPLHILRILVIRRPPLAQHRQIDRLQGLLVQAEITNASDDADDGVPGVLLFADAVRQPLAEGAPARPEALGQSLAHDDVAGAPAGFATVQRVAGDQWNAHRLEVTGAGEAGAQEGRHGVLLKGKVLEGVAAVRIISRERKGRNGARFDDARQGPNRLQELLIETGRGRASGYRALGRYKYNERTPWGLNPG